jgi:4-azaleucine resistance transporter AzlC
MPGTDAARAIRDGWPLLITPFLIGVPFGVLAREAGLDPLQASAMSLLVFAGAAQFASLELFRSGAAPIAIVAAALLINLRHLLMAAALRPHFGDRPLVQRLGLAYVLTDEAFAMGARWYREGGRGVAYYAAFGVALWACWSTGTLIGAVTGPAMPDPRTFGMDYAITAVFIAIVVLGVRERRDIVIALAAALTAGVLRGAGLGVVAVAIAGALAPLVARARERG